jgi:hypothetical protein
VTTEPPERAAIVLKVEEGIQINVSKKWTLERVPGALVQAKLRNLLILLPVDNRPSAVRRQAADLVASVAQLTGRPVHAAQSYRPTLAELPDAATEASEILTLVSAIPDATSRPYVIDDRVEERLGARVAKVDLPVAAPLVGRGQRLHRDLLRAEHPNVVQSVTGGLDCHGRPPARAAPKLKPGSCIPRTLLVLARTMIR